MARLNQEQRADVQQYARRLVSNGVSRRRMDTILKEYSLEKYGVKQSIGKSTHSKFFQQRVSEIREREETVRKGYMTPQKKRQSNYNRLLGQHFLPAEARLLLSRLNKINTNEIRGMAEQRQALYSQFLRRATEENYSRTQFRREWRKTIENFYVSHRSKWIKDWLTFHKTKGDVIKRRKKLGFNAIWDWYGYIKGKLPESEQYDTPRKHRRKPQQPLTPKRIKDAQKIANLQALLEKEADPSIRAWYRELIKKRGG